MNLIKKNILMVVIISLTLIIACGMIYFVIQDTAKMKESTVKVADLSHKINKLNDEKPAPLQENLDKINNDTEQMIKKVAELQSIFGAPYKKAIEAFAEKIELSSEELNKKWRKFYREQRNKGNKRSLIFVNFKTQFDTKQIALALKAFTDVVNSTSIERVNETNISGCVMEGMGLPREMDEISCKQYIRDMQKSMVEYMLNNNKTTETPFGFEGDASKKITFEKFENSMPRPDEVPLIFKHWKLLEDLFKRIKTSNITQLDSLQRDNLLKGVIKNKQYQIFSYTLKVKGSQDAVRTLLNSMIDAYKTNKVYIIKSITLIANDEATSILGSDSTTKKSTTSANRRRRPGGRGLIKDDKKDEVKDSVAILGVSNAVTVTIKFDYIIYIGKEIKGASKN